MTHDLAITNGTIVSPELGMFDADLGIDGESITTMSRSGSLEGDREIDATGKYVMPGVIDPHTHHGGARPLDQDAESESRSGLVGGVTTIGNIYRSGRPYSEIIEDLFDQCEPNYYHDYFFTFSPLSTAHLAEIPKLVEEYGVTSFKWYQRYKHRAAEEFGVDRDMEDDYADDLIQTLADQPGSPLLACHSENTEITMAQRERIEDSEKDEYDSLLRAFPDYAETQGFVAGANLAKAHDYDHAFYAVHVSSGRTADELATLQKAGYDVIGETCPRYLTLTENDSERLGEVMTASPPIRSERDREVLWKRVADGTIQCIGTDHGMKPDDQKEGENYWSVATSFPDTSTMFSLILSKGVHEGHIGLERAVEIVTTNNAKAWNLYPQKGTLRIGTDADVMVFDLHETKRVTPELCRSAANYTPYEGMELTGWPTHTIVRGQVAYEDGEIVGERGYGTYVDRSPETRAQ